MLTRVFPPCLSTVAGVTEIAVPGDGGEDTGSDLANLGRRRLREVDVALGVVYGESAAARTKKGANVALAARNRERKQRRSDDSDRSAFHFASSGQRSRC